MEKTRAMMAFIDDKQPLISIITPVYNGADYLDELIQSVLAQDYPHIEHIIIDDGSNDNDATVAVLKKYPHLRWWSRENKGQYATLNEGLEAAQGSVVTIICADDKYAGSTVFSSVIDFWQEHPDCGCVYGNTLRMNENSELIAIDPTIRKPPYPVWMIRYWLLIQHCSLFIDKSLITEDMLFDLSFRYSGDWDWIIRLMQATKFAYFNQPLSVYREHAVQTTQKVARKKLDSENRRILQRYKANYLLYTLLINQHRCAKALWILREQGLVSLYRSLKNWLNRQ
jgi:glycosyltransferase involved in cell wall biosynthesis